MGKKEENVVGVGKVNGGQSQWGKKEENVVGVGKVDGDQSQWGRRRRMWLG